MKHKVLLLLVAIIWLLLAGCSSPVPELTPSIQASLTPQPEVTVTCTPENTAQEPRIQVNYPPEPALVTPPPKDWPSYTHQLPSPDGQWVASFAFTQYQENQEYWHLFQVARQDGSQVWKIIDLHGQRGDDPIPLLRGWSRDSQLFYYTLAWSNSSSERMFTDRDLYQLDVTSGETSQTPAPVGYGQNPSPDGSWMAYMHPDKNWRLMIRSTLTGADKELCLVKGFAVDVIEGWTIVWAPDSSALALTAIHNDPETGIYYSVIRVEVDSLQVTGLISGSDRRIRVLQWTADEKLLIEDETGSTWWVDANSGKALAQKNQNTELFNTPSPDTLEPRLPAWQTAPAGASDLEVARETLITFFTQLHDGDYASAARLYGGSYDIIRDHNPEIGPEDYAALWEAVCTQQTICLYVARIVEEKAIDANMYEFVLEFVWTDATVFKFGPCCGETTGQPITQFNRQVKKVDGAWLVMEGPVYTP